MQKKDKNGKEYVAHYGIYLGESENYYYIFDSNYYLSYVGRVTGSHSIEKSKYLKYVFYHARNYDEINNQ